MKITLVLLLIVLGTSSAQGDAISLFQNLIKKFDNGIMILPQRYVFFWSMQTNGILDIAIAAQTNGWVGIGWNPLGTQMTGALSCVGFSNNTLGLYFLSGNSPAEIRPISSANILPNFVFTYDSGYMVVEFSYNISAPNEIYQYPFSIKTPISMVFAYSVYKDFNNFGHGLNFTTKNIQLLNGSATPFEICDGHCSGHGFCGPISCACDLRWHGSYCQDIDQWNVLSVSLVHGIMMEIAFGLLIPFGILWVRYFPIVSKSRPWFDVHKNVEGTTFMIAIGAVILAIALVSSSSTIKDLINPSPHPVLGFIIIGLGFIQFCTTLAYPQLNAQRLSTRIAKFLHCWIGRLVLILGWTNAFFGIRALIPHFQILHITLVLFWVVAFIGLEIYSKLSPKIAPTAINYVAVP